MKVIKEIAEAIARRLLIGMILPGIIFGLLGITLTIVSMFHY